MMVCAHAFVQALSSVSIERDFMTVRRMNGPLRRTAVVSAAGRSDHAAESPCAVRGAGRECEER
jgi:hypothetical protein